VEEMRCGEEDGKSQMDEVRRIGEGQDHCFPTNTDRLRAFTVIRDPDHPNFDFEKYLQQLEKESA
jgi:hypothetical protein